MPRKYSTVNGIKVKPPVDDATRKKIERAGDHVEQMQKAAELRVLDKAYYKRIAYVLKYIANDIW